MSSGFQTRSDTNWTDQPQKMDRGLTFRIEVVEELYYLRSENKGADQLHGYRTTDLRLYFSHMQKADFLMTWRNHCNVFTHSLFITKDYQMSKWLI